MMFELLSWLLLCQVVSSSKEGKPFVSKKRGSEVFDETVLTNPRSFDYDFADDLLHVADKDDLYDELLYQLPPFNLYKLGIDRGTTRVPVVTRQWDTWYTKAASISELRVFAPTTASPRLSTIAIKKIFQKRSRNSNSGRSFLNSFTKNRGIDHAALLTTSIPMESSAQPTQTTRKKEKQITTGWSSPTSFTKKTKIGNSHVAFLTTSIPIESSAQPTQTSEKNERQTTSRRSTLTSFRKQPKYTKYHAALLNRSVPIETSTRSSLNSFTKKTKIDKSHAASPTTSDPLKSFTQSISMTAALKKRQSIEHFSSLARNKLQFSKSTRKIKEVISTTMSTLSTSSTFLLRTSRSDQQQARRVFSSVKAVERRKKKIRATVSPRPGGIWRRGTIIFEGADLTSAATMATTTTMTVASVPASVAVLADKNVRRLRKQPATKDRQSQTRVKLAISPELSESTLSSRQLRVPPIKKDGIPKPVVIRQNPESYKGPTFNCRVLNAYNDGVATEHHDPSCTMVFPGLSRDGSCRCYYKVSSRDEYGCAVGFLYACKPLWNRSVVV